MSDHQVTDRASLDRASLAKEASPFLTPEQTSFYLGISQRQLQVLRANGKGPRYRRHSRYIPQRRARCTCKRNAPHQQVGRRLKLSAIAALPI